jgi:hypothetical protein
MAGKIDLLRERYQQFSQGDVEGALSNWTDDFTWEGGSSEDLPGGGTHQGKDNAVRVLQEASGRGTSSSLSPTSSSRTATRRSCLATTKSRRAISPPTCR